MTFPHKVLRNAARKTVTAFNVNAPAGHSPVYTASESHPSFEQVVEGLETGDPNVWALFDVAASVQARFRSITPRVSYNGRDILWDGDPVHSVLAEQLTRMLESGQDGYEALAKFWEKLESNPNAHSRTQSYDWLAAHDFKITPEGDVVGYKGVLDEGNGQYRSWHRSESVTKPAAYVDGTPAAVQDYVRSPLGSVVSMPRSEVEHDPSRSCSRGLHVAVFTYAKNYGNAVLEVHVNPRDICSVPTHAHGHKVRVCSYKVVGVRTAEVEGVGPILDDNADTWTGDVGYKV